MEEISLASETASQIQRALIKEGVMVSPSVRIEVILPIITSLLNKIDTATHSESEHQ